MNSKEKFYTRVSQITLALIIYTLLVILWGAWVRISHSGDGCGDTWPLCQGQLIPQEAMKKTWVEYSHRFTSGLYGLLVIGLYFWLKRKFSQKELGSDSGINYSTMKWSFWVLVFMITEALLGAKLVIFRLVSLNDSVWRLVVMSLHQLNSFLLVAFTVRLFCSTFEPKLVKSFLMEQKKVSPDSSPEKELKTFFGFPVPLFLIIALAMTGAWAALSTTLFPSVSLVDGLVKDFANDSHYLLKLRVTHPFLGIVFGSFMAIMFYKKAQDYLINSSGSSIRSLLYKTAMSTSMAIASGVIIGIITLLSLSPVALKIIHLTIAHVLWSLFISFYHFYSLHKSIKIKTE